MTIAQTVAAYDKRVDRGIAWLNKNKPGWLKKINVAKLNLANYNVCILGQSYKNYWNIVTDENDGLTEEQAEKMGFHDLDGEYDLLTAIWYEKIKCMRS